jgi:hypothetical protein
MVHSAIVLQTWESATNVISHVVTIAAICFGGVWAYLRFVRERTRWPRAEIELSVTHHRLDEKRTVLHAKIQLRNVGRGLMKLEELRVYLQRVRPLGPQMREFIDEGDPFNSSQVEAAWPLITEHERTWAKDKPELEPGKAMSSGSISSSDRARKSSSSMRIFKT